jgi:dTDP-4-dehydrorhamnose 3,5-epimerase
MELSKTDLPGVLLVTPRVFTDERGFFLETWHKKKWADQGQDIEFVQDNHSKSKKGTLRGLHCQLQQPQGKLVRCIEGAIYDVAVDIRVGSPHFGQWTAATLTSENYLQLYVPEGFAHGFLVLSEHAQVEYKCTNYYHPASELSILWSDPDLKIPWPTHDPNLSTKDRAAPRLKDVMTNLPFFHKPS